MQILHFVDVELKQMVEFYVEKLNPHLVPTIVSWMHLIS